MRECLWTLALVLLSACSPAVPAAETPPAPPVVTAGDPAISSSVAAGNAAFGVALYQLLAREPGNVFVSPVSLAGAFGPVVAGAQGDTRAAIAATLQFPGGGGASLHPALGGLLRDLERADEGATLSIANALWVAKDFSLKPDFGSVARDAYDAKVDTLDFARAPGPSADRINAWVKEETRGRITKLIAADTLDEYTALIVTNAVYFLGDWAVPFNASNTVAQPFHLAGGATRAVPLMYRKGGYRYFETDDFQAIDLPYKDARLSMSILLPRAPGGLPALEAEVSAAKLGEWLGRLDREQPREVRLHLPKLKIEEDYQLVEPLRALGMGIAFTDKADFRGIADADLAIGQVVHKSFLRIDEKGTEAAAATGVEIEVTSAPRIQPPVFRADRPFFLVIREKPSGALLFLGRIASPGPA